MTRKLTCAAMLLFACSMANSAEMGTGRDNNDPDTLPPETSEATTPATANLWQSLLDLFETEER